MSLARLVVTAVRIEGRSKSEVARAYQVSRRWVHELVKRYDQQGEAGLVPRSRRPRTSPRRTPQAVDEEVVELRKHLAGQGLDAGAHTIAYHLRQRHGHAPAPATIWRILSRRGFVTPQTAEAAPQLLRPLPGRHAQRALAGRRHPLGPRRRQRGGGPQPA